MFVLLFLFYPPVLLFFPSRVVTIREYFAFKIQNSNIGCVTIPGVA
jgi:hypothetical protein